MLIYAKTASALKGRLMKEGVLDSRPRTGEANGSMMKKVRLWFKKLTKVGRSTEIGEVVAVRLRASPSSRSLSPTIGVILPGELDAPVRFGEVLGEVHAEAENVALLVAQHDLPPPRPVPVATAVARVAPSQNRVALDYGDKEEGLNVPAVLGRGEGAAAALEGQVRIEIADRKLDQLPRQREGKRGHQGVAGGDRHLAVPLLSGEGVDTLV